MTLDLLDLLSAIASAEGAFVPDSVPRRNSNPTDLRFANQYGAVTSPDGTPPFAKFDCWERGVVAGLRQILKDIGTAPLLKPLTLRELIYSWAPPTDGNNSAVYLIETVRRIKACSGLEIDPGAPLWSYLEIQHIP